ncbi:hypothetical protein ONE63_000120 [Megalurothrips usitatus]|uniref:MYND-type domain-containing protein n=1 Tax=Megalurothrips usitatus TaxID=439358 RepID=A0AAV7Y1I3_9NEOP|nr:hypothetical protein ONE63_000120 [Megalurothrips usitatus]
MRVAANLPVADEESSSDVKLDDSSHVPDAKETATLAEQKELFETGDVISKEQNSTEPEDGNEISKESILSPKETLLNDSVCDAGEVSVKVERDSLSSCEEPQCLSDDQKETSLESDAPHDEEINGSSESEASIKDNGSGGSEEFQMDVDLSNVDVKTEVNEDQEKSTDSGIVSEQTSRKVTQKRASEEDLSNSQAKKQCLPDIVCGDANALDLSGIKKDPKEPKIALKPQSLLLSKLQSSLDVDRSKKNLYRDDDSGVRTIDNALPSKTVRRRSSRDDKDTRSTHHQRRSNESGNSSRALERDQVLREMRTRVRSSYKERERAAKEDNSLLRDLLEPERDSVMTDFVDAHSGGVSELDRVSAALEVEIRQLTVEINAKEAEWNDLIRKKKLKEELAMRIQRRKQVLSLTGETDDNLVRRNSFEEDSRPDAKRDSNMDMRHDRRNNHYREVSPKMGEELLAVALRLGSRNVEDYHHRSSGSSPLAVRIQARANELLTGTTPTVERKPSGPLPGLSHMQTPSLLQSQLTKPTDISPSSSQSQFLLQHLQRQRVLMGAVSSTGSACRLSPSVSLSAIPTPTSTSSTLNASLPSAAVHNKSLSRAEKHANAASASRIQRPILPKPSTATSGGHVVSDSTPDGSGKGIGIIGEGRQGPIIDVQSIIADYRSQHPENVPRRGRRMKSSGLVSDSIMASARPGSSSGGGLLSMSLPALGSGSHVRTGSSGSGLHGTAPVDLSELGFVLSSGGGSEGPSRPSSTESSLSGAPSQINPETSSGMYRDILVQFAKMTNANEQNTLSGQGGMLSRPPQSPFTPEVTLHPVVAQGSGPVPVASPVQQSSGSAPTTSLLHGILTKPSNQSSNSGSQSHSKPTTFSPTLARLLTAPERSSSLSAVHHASPVSGLPHYQTTAASNYGSTGPVLLSDLLSGGSSKKARSELTITPVAASSATSNSMQSSLMPNTRDGEDGGDMNGDEGDADTDSDERRLVIDEGDNGESPGTDGRLDRSKSSVPHCQGCNERDAEFVCAGCQRQWYCSRECQIAAWDEHSEQCFPASSDN